MRSQYTLPRIYELAWPAIISHATVMFLSMTDLAFASRLTNATLVIAATAVAHNASAAIYSFLEGLRIGTTVLVARFWGEKLTEGSVNSDATVRISKTINSAFQIALILSITLVIASPFLSMFVFGFLEPQISALGKSYLMIRLLGIPFHLIIFVITGMLRGLRNTILPFFVTLVVCISNLLLNYLFIQILPTSQVHAISIATVVSYVIGAIFSIVLFFRLPLTNIYINFKLRSIKMLRELTRIGLEIGFYACIVVVALFLFILTFKALGPQALAAHQIVFQTFLIAYLAPMGFFIASSIIIGKLIGENDTKSVIPATIKIWATSLPLILGISILCSIFASTIATFFSPQDPVVAQTATNAIYLICIVLFFYSIFSVLKGTLTAAKDTRFILVAGIITSYFIFLPLSYFMGITLGYGIFGGYLAFLFWTILDCTILTIRCFVTKPWTL